MLDKSFWYVLIIILIIVSLLLLSYYGCYKKININLDGNEEPQSDRLLEDIGDHMQGWGG